MTESEAKGFIQGKLDCMKKYDTFDCKNSDECDECNYCYAQGTFGEQKEAFQMAIKALEKQIEMKKYCNENTCVNCSYSNPLSDDSKCMNDFIIEME